MCIKYWDKSGSDNQKIEDIELSWRLDANLQNMFVVNEAKLNISSLWVQGIQFLFPLGMLDVVDKEGEEAQTFISDVLPCVRDM